MLNGLERARADYSVPQWSKKKKWTTTWISCIFTLVVVSRPRSLALITHLGRASRTNGALYQCRRLPVRRSLWALSPWSKILVAPDCWPRWHCRCEPAIQAESPQCTRADFCISPAQFSSRIRPRSASLGAVQRVSLVGRVGAMQYLG